MGDYADELTALDTVTALPDAGAEYMKGDESGGSDVINRTAIANRGYIENLVDSAIGHNLIKNGNFEQWSDGASSDPDNWDTQGAGVSIARVTTKKSGSYAAQLTYGSAAAVILQNADEYIYYQGKYVTLAAWVKCSTANCARINLYDGVGDHNSSYHTGGGGWELLKVSADVDASATLVQTRLQVDIAGNAIFDLAKTEEGQVATAFTPCFVSPYATETVRNKTTDILVRDIFRDLVVKTNVSNPTYQVDVDVNEVVLQDSTNLTVVARAVNLTVDITASGANGLDTGSEAGSTWYYVWVIYNASTDTVAGLLSTSYSAPTLPSGYTFKAIVGAVRNDSGSDFIAFYQEDKHAEYNAVQTIKDGSFTTGSWTSLSVTALFPVTAKRLLCAFGSDQSQIKGLSPRSDGHAGSYFKLSATGTSSFSGVMPTVRADWQTMEIRGADPIYYYVETGANETLVAIGWEY